MLIQSEIISLFNKAFSQTGKVRKSGWQLTYHCPFCPDKNLATRKLEIAILGPNTGNYHCWRCNVKGRTFGTLLRKLKAPDIYREQLFKLTGDIKSLKRKRQTFDSLHLPAEFHPLYIKSNSIEYKNAIAYVYRRGLSMDDIIRYNIGYCESGEYAYCIIVPSYDYNGILNFFVGRKYYQNSNKCPHKKPNISTNIVAFENLINYNEPINLCEGIFDAMTIKNNAIPLLGKFPSKLLLQNFILNKVTHVNMILDNDALTHAIKNCHMIYKLGISVSLIQLDQKDPSIIGFENINKLINQARPLEFQDFLAYRLKL